MEEDWVYNEQGLMLISEHLMERIITHLHKVTHFMEGKNPITGDKSLSWSTNAKEPSKR